MREQLEATVSIVPKERNFKISSDRFSEHKPLGGGQKRLFDVVFACLAIAACAVPFILIAALLKLVSPGPVLFRHGRVGYGGHAFGCLKFRTMVVSAEDRLVAHLAANPHAHAEFARTRKLRNDPRVIPGLGHFLRKTSLDELPQFLNVLKGDMSIVGPRPVTRPELEDYGLHAASYLRTRPGITGLWQVSGRSSLSFDDRIAIDVAYIENWSIRQDIALTFKTVGVLVNPKDAC